MSEDDMVWDLAQLVEDTNPEALKRELKTRVGEAERIREKYILSLSNARVP
jgi:hypothetical protein